MTLRQILNRIRLNLRAAKLALTGRWLTPGDVAVSYDALAATYQANWLTHLCRTTDRLHEQLPVCASPTMHIIDLGCGTGYSTAFLAQKYPTANITAVDISGEMINQAKATLANPVTAGNGAQRSDRIITPNNPVTPFVSLTSFPAANVQFAQGDMLRYLESQPGQSCDLVFSAWAIGYSAPAKIIAEAYRVLRPGGTLAVIVNRLSTMPAVFAAFRKTMRAFPASLEKAMWPRFPRNVGEIESYLNRHAFKVQLLEDDIVPIEPPEPGQRLNWLLGTGVLAGFDSVLPIQPRRPEDGNNNTANDMRQFFERELNFATSGWEHHYVMFIATLAASPCDAHVPHDKMKREKP